MKKAMLCKVEGREMSKSVLDKHAPANSTKKAQELDENESREEMLYRNYTDNMIDTQLGGGDVLNTSSQIVDS